MASFPVHTNQSRSTRSDRSISTPRVNEGLTEDDEQGARTFPNNSQPVVLNSPSQHSPTNRSSETTPPSPPKAEPRHCWICLQDEGEDSDIASEWRSPCPCNLQAHEECMLEWIADLEAPSPNNEPVTKILCPQCKAEIKVARPHDYIVSATDAVARLARQLVMPAALSAGIGCLYSGLTIYGLNALSLVFGPEDTTRIMWASRRLTARRGLVPHSQIWASVLKITDPFLPFISLQDWYILLCLPSIAPALVLARTSLADRAFTSLPILYFTFRPENRNIRWPPSPGLAFVSLPYIRLVYKALYRQIFSDLEKQWDLAIQRKPREGETAEEVAQARNERQEANGLLDIEVEIINVQADEEVHAAPGRPAQPQQGEVAIGREAGPQIVDNEQIPQGGQPEGDMDPAGRNADANAPAPAANEPWEFRQNISTAQVARTVVGALFFPAISSLMGDLLKYTLPKKYVTSPSKVKFSADQLQATGLLQEKWGRSIVGGCLFVLLKDALILYTKWRKAKNQGKRRVLDYVKRKTGS